mgnify:FL=1
MRLTIQRVREASVQINQKTTSQINQGLLVLIGIGTEDGEADIEWLCNKILALRIFSDGFGKMNKSIADVNGDILLVSQFTLFASTKKGNRPSYIRSARPDTAITLYRLFHNRLEVLLGKPVPVGEFGADMKVFLCNDGPVTLNIDSKNRE